MTVERTCVSCDNCNNFISTGMINFKAKIAKAKRRGWFIYKLRENIWRHWCPDCAPEFKDRFLSKPRTVQQTEGEYWWQKY